MSNGLTDQQIEFLFLHLAVLLFLARLLGEAMRKIGQPPVLGELMTGFLIGPTLLGWVSPTAYSSLFPGNVNWSGPLETVSWIGLVLLMLITGLETDVRLLRNLGRQALFASVFGLIFPFGAGLALGFMLPNRFIHPEGSRVVTSLFLATALSISAMPVIAKILVDLGLIRRNLGVITLTAAIVDDTIGWIMLAVISGLVHQGSLKMGPVAQTIGLLAAFLFASRRVLYPLARWALRKGGGAAGLARKEYAIIFTLTFLCAAITERIGVHAVFGAFVAGAMLRQCPSLSPDVIRRIEGLAMTVFAPIFFAIVGLKVDFTQTQGLLWPGAILLVAILGKVVGCSLGGLLGRMSFVEALTLAFGMNARGAMGLVVAVVGLNLDAIGPELFAAIVLMAVVTSFLAPILIRPLVKFLPITDEERERDKPLREGFLPTGPLHLLTPTAGGRNAALSCHIASVLCENEEDCATAIYVETERALFWKRRSGLDAGKLFNSFGKVPLRTRGRLTSLKIPSKKNPGEAILEEARKGCDVLFLGASEHSHPVYDPFLSGIVKGSPCHVVIVRAPRGGGANEPNHPLRKIIVPTNGSHHSDAAFELAARYASLVDAQVCVLYVVESQGHNPLLPNSGFDPSDEGARESMLVTLRAQFAARLHPDLLECRIVEGKAVVPILAKEVTARGFDLVVLGAENKSIVERLYLGQTVDASLERIDAAIAVVIPKISRRRTDG